MNILSLKLLNYRNFAKYELEPQNITILIGPNGVGKTNLLEAIYLLSVCRSYRTRRDQEVIKWDEDTARIEIDAEDVPPPLQGGEGGGEAAVDWLNIAIAQTGDKKITFIGGKQVPVSLLVGKLPVVIFAPEDMDLLYASPARRRRQLDVMLSQINHKYLDNLIRYNRIIKLRNKILQGIGARKNKEDELNFWDKELVGFGTQILLERQEISRQIDRALKCAYKEINDINKKITLTFNYLTNLGDSQKFDEMLTANREQEIRYGTTITGPHRDDWQMKFGNLEARVAASRGQTRAVILALKMAQAEILKNHRQTLPIILLDDIFAELDRNHSHALFNFIGQNQVIITATDAEYIPQSIKKKAENIKLCV